MDAQELINMLNQILDLGDSMDENGVMGVKALTNGTHTTREVTRLELGRFLLYIASGNGVLTDGEVSLINVAFGLEYSAYQYRQLEAQTNYPDPSNSLSLMGFLSGDIVLSKHNGHRSTVMTDALIGLFESYGGLMVAFDDNPVSRARKLKYISEMKSYVSKNLKY